MRHQITHKQRKWVVVLPQILFKTVSRNFQSLLSFTLLIYHFTRSRYREKPLFGAWKPRGKNSFLLFQLNFCYCANSKRLYLLWEKELMTARKKNYLKSAIWGLTHMFSCLGWQPIFSCMYFCLDIKNPYKISHATLLCWLWIKLSKKL